MNTIMKKEYRMPVIKVVNLSAETILAGSGDINTGKQVKTGNNDYIGVGGPWEGEID